MKVRAWILCCLAAAALYGQIESPEQARIRKLENSLLAPCCWAEPIAQHRSDVALQMRREIEEFVRAGKSDREILDFYKQKYGPRVLVEPEGALWWWMHVVPFAVLAASVIVVGLVLRRWLKPLPAS
jgi:cytochrome c-type biogenesis protein CcmH